MTIKNTIILCAIVLWSCSKKSTESNNPTPQNSSESLETKMENAQKEVATGMCQRITDCAVEAAQAQLSEKQEIDQAMVDEKLASCVKAYTETKMSGRQINGVASCLANETECSVFVTCISGALKPTP